MTTAAPARGQVARPARPQPSIGLIAGLVAAAGFTVWAARGVDFTLAPLFTNITRGWVIIEQFLSPNWAFALRIWPAWLETLAIAVIASITGCLVGLVFAALASRVTNRQAWFHRAIRTVLSVVRSLPDIAYALIFVAIVGVGSLAGILALFFFNLGIAAKLTSETIDAVDPGPLEAADAAGASALQRVRVAVLPQIMPNYLSYCLYIFELNIRASVVIGIAGGGGIGQVLSVELNGFRYGNMSALIIALFVVVFAIDLLSQRLRRRFT